MTIMDEPTDQPVIPPPLPSSAPSGKRRWLLPSRDLENQEWELSAKPPWYVRWRGGWRLFLVLTALGMAYLAWRGRADYHSLQRWRAHRYTTQARAISQSDPALALKLLEQALALAPADASILRGLVDFCEPRQDHYALTALRQLAHLGHATPADMERLCRLAVEWSVPDQAHLPLLKTWSEAPVSTLTTAQLAISSRWLAGRGLSAFAESRLRTRLDTVPGEVEVELGLCTLLSSRPTPSTFTLEEITERLERVVSNEMVPSPLRLDAARMLGKHLLGAAKSLFTESRATQLRDFFRKGSQSESAELALLHHLASSSLEVAISPTHKAQEVQRIVALAKGAPLPRQMKIIQWLADQGAMQEALALTINPEAASNAAWCRMRLELLHAVKDFTSARIELTAEGSPLSPLLRQFFLYRLDLDEKKAPTTLAAHGASLETLAGAADGQEVIQVATILEKLHEWPLARTLYRKVSNHPRVGLQARLGTVRCMDASGDNTAELMKALDEVLVLAPQMAEAQNDLVYLKILEDKATTADRATARLLHGVAPWNLSYRITAALADLAEKRGSHALAILEKDPTPWDQVRPGWQAVYASALAAGERTAEARAIATRLEAQQLRSCERRWLARALPAAP